MFPEQHSTLSQFGQERRWVLKAGLTIGAAGVGFLLANRFGLIPRSEFKGSNEIIPSELTGIIPNCHHLPYIDNQEIQEKLIQNIVLIGASCTRVFLDDIFEPKIGDYKKTPIEKVARLSRRLPITVDLFDAYSALHAPGPKSPYLIDKQGRDLTEKQMAIFTDPDIGKMLARRLRVAVQELKDEPGIKAWGMANELRLGINEIGWMRDLHSDLFQQLIEAILSVDRSRPIFIGIDDPNLVIEERFTQYQPPVINTIHAYPYSSHLKMVYDYRSKEEHFLPLACQEVGYPRAYEDKEGFVVVTPDYDRVLSQFSMQIFNGLTDDGVPAISAWGPWRISTKGDPHHDGFEIIPNMMPNTIAVFNLIEESLIPGH